MTVLSDNFNRADSSDLGASWEELNGDVRVLNNSIYALDALTRAQVRRTDDLASSDQYVQAKVSYLQTPVGNTSAFEVLGRHSAVAGNMACYVFRYTVTTGGGVTAELGRRASDGTFTSITSAGDTIVAGDIVRLEVTGTSLIGKKNGTQVLSTTDSTITSGLRSGFGLIEGTDATYDFTLDDWEAGDLAGPPVTLDPVAMPWTGKELTLPATVNLNPADLSWVGKTLGINAKTQIILDPMTVAWLGRTFAGFFTSTWNTYTGWLAPTISSGQVTSLPQSTTECIAVDTSVLLPADQYAQCTLRQVPTVGLILRGGVPPEANSMYGCSAFASGAVNIFRYLNGTYTELARSGAVSTASGVLLSFEARGPNLTAFIDNAAVLTVSDSNITGAGYAGVRAMRAAGSPAPTLDDFFAGDFTIAQGGVTVDPADMAWTGKSLGINAKTQLTLTPATLAWAGKNLVFRDTVPLAPMALTWNGQLLGISGQQQTVAVLTFYSFNPMHFGG